MAVVVMFAGCRFVRMTIQDEIIYATKRVELHYSNKDKDRRSPLLFMSQTVVKEIEANGNSTVNIYDNLTLQSSSFNIENKVFIIIDDEVFPMNINLVENEHI